MLLNSQNPSAVGSITTIPRLNLTQRHDMTTTHLTNVERASQSSPPTKVKTVNSTQFAPHSNQHSQG